MLENQVARLHQLLYCGAVVSAATRDEPVADSRS